MFDFTFREQFIFVLYKWPWKQAHVSSSFHLSAHFSSSVCDSCWVCIAPHTHLLPQTCCCCSVCLKGPPLVEKGFRERKTGRSKKNQRRQRQDKSCLYFIQPFDYNHREKKQKTKGNSVKTKTMWIANNLCYVLKMCFCYLRKMSVSVRLLQRVPSNKLEGK